MLVPIEWIKNYVEVSDDILKYTDRLSETGSHVDGVIKYTDELEGIKVGRILSINHHDKANNLFVLKIKTDKELTIVTSAKGLKENDLILVIESGYSINGKKIEDHDFFGIKSEGMLISYSELKYPDNVIPKKLKDTVVILSGNFKEGENAVDVLKSNTPIVDFEITPNRPDCLSILGMARESAASFETKVNLPNEEFNSIDKSFADFFDKVEVTTNKCNRIVAKIATDIKVKQSPQWMQNYLMLAGMRPINNIVDITNFVMLEYGQPLHAYDLDKLKSKTMIIRNAQEGEKVETLDGTLRDLDENDIVISDKEEIIGIAGIMGGLDSEVTENTKTILLEAANFDKDSIRKTSKKLALRTEASNRFEKGIPVENANFAANRVMHLIDKLSIGHPLKDGIDIGKKNSEEKIVNLRISRLNLLIGHDFTKEDAKKYLKFLEFEIVDETDSTISVKVPYYRLDIDMEADLSEEIARLYGFSKIEGKPLKVSVRPGSVSERRKLIDDLKIAIYAQKFIETATYSFVSPKIYDDLLIDKNSDLRNYPVIINPLGVDFSVMRTTLIANNLEVISKNIKRKQNDMRIFEIGNTFFNNSNKLPNEYQKLCMTLYGNYDFYDLKNYFINAMNNVGIYGFEFETLNTMKTFHEGRCAKILLNGKEVGVIGQISYALRENYQIKNGCYVLEINLDYILENRKYVKIYKKLPKYPAIEIDLSLVADKDTKASKIEKIILSNSQNLLDSIELFDIYTGNQVEDGKKSVSYSLMFRSDDKTLTDDEINPILQNIISKLKDEDIFLRS
ncbi:MAG: phenylalanine--tRNA ligase subunit beta [Peptoniphilaceae bacterium]|nr:phenylalanine--tRNA ligase subunit beta [Peptoniphilaceae bacterium]MDD7383280.1 phenylalanine--tRNA ligase subunit beta [Peptoniphilaceae bacterium]MDY3738349.1 phenylalanine--tRNA ligase subunit beta [Peptoniphilaceae bacterium]